MINLSKIEEYRENNRLEAKKSLGGLPQSIWETYSAFANTLGGIILLGVVEEKDKSFKPIKLPAPQKLVEAFFEGIRSGRVSANILSDKDVAVQKAGNYEIVTINVPRAARYDKPIYVDNDPYSGSYRRGGEGDYRCSREEVENMLRDAAVKSYDMRILESMDATAIDGELLKRFAELSMDEVLVDEDKGKFAVKIGALTYGKDKMPHPTVAGLLMFGKKEGIDENLHEIAFVWENAQLGEKKVWYNVFEFYCEMCARFKTIFKRMNIEESHKGELYASTVEMLVNSLVNADYGRKGEISVVVSEEKIVFSNPGSFRLDVEAARTGGTSDPRNLGIMKMFDLLGVTEREGKGIPTVFAVWKRARWGKPMISESFEPDRITVTLPLMSGNDEEGIQKTKSFLQKRKSAVESVIKKQIIWLLTVNASLSLEEMASLIPLSQAQLTIILDKMIIDNLLEFSQENGYRLKY